MKKYKNKEVLRGDDFWYDITDGGYIIPEKILVDQEKAKKLTEAVELLEAWKEELIEDGKLDEDL